MAKLQASSPVCPSGPSRRPHTKRLLSELYGHFKPGDQVLITVDPDPDALGAALAVKRLLWRRVQSVTIGTIRSMRRLNNLTLVRLLKLPLVLLTKGEQDLSKYDKYIIVDGQPDHNDLFKQFPYTAVIDHHPLNTLPEVPFVDIRPEYGATSTMLTQYLRTAKIRPNETLATTLYYGIKTDTRSFERHTTPEDIEAFRYLYPFANHHILRKVEISDLSLNDLRFFHKAVEKRVVVKDRIFAHLDDVSSADILVEIAEFFLKIHDISWSIISGIYEGNLIIVVRNDGYRKDAGKLIRKEFGALGSAGGHQSMARAEIPAKKLAQVVPAMTSAAIERFVIDHLSP